MNTKMEVEMAAHGILVAEHISVGTPNVEPSVYVGRCHRSRTGWAVYKSPCHCTCNPANPPEERRK